MRADHKTASALFLISSAAVAAIAVTALGSPDPGEATHSQATIALIAVDAGIGDNTATSLGPADTCLEIAAGAIVEVDVTVSAIPADRPLTAFQFDLFYDPAIVNVVGSNNAMLLATNTDFRQQNVGDQVPDSDADFVVAIADFSASAGETGSGVLSRIALEAVGSGLANLSPANTNIRDNQNEAVLVNALAAAYLAVGQPCPSETPPVLTSPPGTTPPPQPSATPGQPTPTAGTPGPGDTPDDERPGASGTLGTGNSGVGNGNSKDGNDSGGVSLWIVALVVAGLLGLGGAGYAGLWWWRRRAGR